MGKARRIHDDQFVSVGRERMREVLIPRERVRHNHRHSHCPCAPGLLTHYPL